MCAKYALDSSLPQETEGLDDFLIFKKKGCVGMRN